MVGSHGLGSRDFGAEYEIPDELTSRIRTLANVTDGRFNVDGSFALVLLPLNRFEAVAICVLFDVDEVDEALVVSGNGVFTGDFFASIISFDVVSLFELSQRLE